MMSISHTTRTLRRLRIVRLVAFVDLVLLITGFVIAIVLLGLGDGALRPAILRIKQPEDTSARRWATIAFVLTVLAVGIMTGATFVD